MSDMRSLALTRAYELVEAGKSDEARTVLEPILLNDRDNVDAWWIYAHAVDDPVEARRALDHVIRLDRDYPGAAELMVTLNQQYPEDAPEPVPVIADEPGIADLEPEFADDDSRGFIRQPGSLRHRGAGGNGERQRGEDGVAGTRHVSNFASGRRQITIRPGMIEPHAVLAACDQYALHAKALTQRY